jgi:hypothetical protein
MSIHCGNVQALLALFFIIKKCPYLWLKQSKKSAGGGSNPLSIRRCGWLR